MSSGKKMVLIVATILVIGGCAIAFGAFAAAGFNPENLSTESHNWTSTTKTFDPEAESPHSAIVLHDTDENVRIEPTDSDAIEVTYWANERKSFDAVDDGDTVTIEGSHESYIGIMMIGSFEDHTTVVKVPRSYIGTLDIDTTSGNVNASFSGSDDEYAIEASSVSGNVHAPAGSSTASKHVSAHTMSGNVTLSFDGGASVGGGNSSGTPAAPDAPTAPTL